MIRILEILGTTINKFVQNSKNSSMRITEAVFNKNGRSIVFTVRNPNLEEHRQLLENLFTCLQQDVRFITFCENKIIIVSALINGHEYSFHHNVLINSLTTFDMYWDKVKDHVKSNFGHGYGVTVIPNFRVRVWNGDLHINRKIKITSSTTNRISSGIQEVSKIMISSIFKHSNIVNTLYSSTKFNLVNRDIVRCYVNPNFVRGMSTKANVKKEAPSIKPYSEKRLNRLAKQNMENFATSDLETMEIGGVQVPVLISYVNEFETKYFIIDHGLLKVNQEAALNKLWNEYFEYIKQYNSGASIDSEMEGRPKTPVIETIFFHNLGAFDGYFIYKALMSYTNPDDISTIIDESNKFITIKINTVDYSLTFKDSLRIFPMSLSGLCKTFGVEGKSGKYNQAFNKLDLFDNQSLLNKFIEYGVQDSVALYNALVNAQKQLFNDFKLDIVSSNIVSTSSLAFNVFRSKFLKTPIPILNNAQDSFIRRGYFGGATDYYKKYAVNAKYYDANSLYPTAMLNDMPGKVIKFHNSLKFMKLDKFFGFALAEITIPNGTMRPLLPYKSKDGRTIFPTGIVVGVYFSEELKALAKLGYKITLIKGYEHERIKDLFNGFINHFYEIKKNAKGAERALAKLIMNSSYGNFGRKSDLLVTKNVKNEDLDDYVVSSFIQTIIKINDEYSTILMKRNLPTDIIDALKINLERDFENYESPVNNNVAIASAITSYARIYMMDYKLSDSVIYTDTDSVIMTNEIDLSLIGPELGQMKDELDGGFMNEIFVLGIKQYGYHYNNQGSRINCSVFAGAPRNSINFDEFLQLSQGVTLHRELPARFNRNFGDLSITIKPASITLKANYHKKLIGNNYIPPHIVDLNHELDNRPTINKFVKKYWHFVKKYIG
jgi:hypothetical protein